MDENKNHAVDEPVTTPDLPARQPLGVQNKEDFPNEGCLQATRTAPQAVKKQTRTELTRSVHSQARFKEEPEPDRSMAQPPSTRLTRLRHPKNARLPPTSILYTESRTPCTQPPPVSHPCLFTPNYPGPRGLVVTRAGVTHPICGAPLSRNQFSQLVNSYILLLPGHRLLLFGNRSRAPTKGIS
jgi:hypothetical protein